MQPFLQAADTGALAILLFNFAVKHVAFDLLYHAVCAWVLPIKNPRVYWAAAIACQIVGNMLLPIGLDPTQRVLWYLTDYVFIPYLCWRGPRTVRAVAIAIGVIAELTVETSTMVLYSVLGLPLTAQVTSSPLEFAVRVAGLVALAILGLALRRLFARQREAILAYDRTAADGSRPLDRAAPDGSGQVEDAEDAAPYGRFLATQGFVILVLYTAYFCGGLGIIPTSLALVMLGVPCSAPLRTLRPSSPCAGSAPRNANGRAPRALRRSLPCTRMPHGAWRARPRRQRDLGTISATTCR